MVRPDIEAIMRERYGFVPKPTEGEEKLHELLALDPRKFNQAQEMRDALRLAEVANRTGDPLSAEIALRRWNIINPDNQYSSIKLLVGVESSE